MTSSGAVNTSSVVSPMTWTDSAIRMAEAPTAMPMATWARISSRTVTPKRVRRRSARIAAAATESAAHTPTTITAMRSRVIHHSGPSRSMRATRGRKSRAMIATLSSLRARSPQCGGRPTMTCGSSPSAMPTATTATTCTPEWGTGSPAMVKRKA